MWSCVSANYIAMYPSVACIEIAVSKPSNKVGMQKCINAKSKAKWVLKNWWRTFQLQRQNGTDWGQVFLNIQRLETTLLQDTSNKCLIDDGAAAICEYSTNTVGGCRPKKQVVSMTSLEYLEKKFTN